MASKKRLAKIKAILANDFLPRKPLADAVRARITELGLSRAAAAKRVGDAASQMSRLMHGHDDEFSADRLIGFLGRLGVEVTVVMTRSASRRTRCAVGGYEVMAGVKPLPRRTDGRR